MKIVLGSASKRRRQILLEMGYKFEVMTADIDEKAIRHENPNQMVLDIANAKADALIPKLDHDTLLVTADLIVVFDGKVLEKPATKQEAREVLQDFGDRPAKTVCAVVITNTATGRRVSGVDIATVWFKPFDENLFKNFVDTPEALEHAGSFAAETEIFQPYVKKIEGTIDSIAGLPKDLVRELIEKVK